MTQEEKELLLKDLCARSPYKVKVQIDFGEHCIKYGIDRYVNDTVICVWPETFEVGVNDEDQACNIEDVKPYLRPMSSMTDEEMDKLFNILHIDKDGKDEDWIKINDIAGIKFFFPTGKWVENVAEAYDYFNLIHIDYRGLIPMGLAIEAPEGMYNTK